MLSRLLIGIGLATIALLGVSDRALTQSLCAQQSGWKVKVVLFEGTSLGLFLRLDRPVDHARSSLVIVGNGNVVRTLEPLLETEPDLVFARTPMLAPGDYALQWSVRTGNGDVVDQGTIPFTVNAPGPGPRICVLAERG